MKKQFRTIACLLLSLAFVLLCGVTSFASESFESYTYRADGVAQKTATPYKTAKVLSGKDFGVEDFANPRDVAVRDGLCYLLDGNTGRILVLDEDFSFVRTITTRRNAREDMTFEQPEGIYVAKDGRIMVADRKAGYVYIFSEEGKLVRSLGKPGSSLVTEEFFFEPIRVTEDSGGVIYVLSAGSYQGALQYDANGEFLGFYGSEKVVVTPKVLLNYFWKQLLTDEAAAGLERALPVEFVSFDMDDGDFIYTVREGNDVTSDQVRRLNAKGENILASGVYGDLNRKAMLSDICVDKDGFFTILDSQTGKLFQYAENGQLLYAFGGKGSQNGCFEEPSALCAFGDKLLVLDSAKNTLTVFEPTEFAQNIRQAMIYEKTGSYFEAEPHWQVVKKADFRYELAGIGLGKAAEKRGDNVSAMENYRVGNDRDLYSQAFGKLRDAFIREYFSYFLLLIFALAILLLIVNRRKKKKKVEFYGGGRSVNRYPLYCVLHPIAGFEDLKDEKSGSMVWATGILAVFFAVSVLKERATGFIFNTHGTENFNLLITLFSSLGLFFLFLICNWAATTIADGKGSLKEIYIFLSYSLVPYIFGSLFLVICSLVLTREEAAFYQIFETLVYAWSGLQIFLALRAVHMYTVKKNFWMCLCTVLGLVVIVVICAIIYSVFSQFVGFLGSAVLGELFK